MFVEVLPPTGKPALALLSQTVKGFYLAGGTGLALQLGHRISGDLDFFTLDDFEPWILRDKMAESGHFTLASESRGTLHGIFNSVKVSFLHYNYPLLFPTIDLEGIEVADLRDIALIKITAISSRGSKKDFVDLFFVCQTQPLDTLLELFSEKYRSANYSQYHILKSLTFFDDAESEPDPVMLKPWSWKNVKEYFTTTAINLGSKF